MYIKTRAEANKQNKTTVSLCVSVCAVHSFCLCSKNRAAISGGFYFSVTKNEINGPVIVKKITINKNKRYGTLRDESVMQLNIRPGSERKNNTFIKQIFRSGWMGSLQSKTLLFML